jgi:hypothetical protein
MEYIYTAVLKNLYTLFTTLKPVETITWSTVGGIGFPRKCKKVNNFKAFAESFRTKDVRENANCTANQRRLSTARWACTAMVFSRRNAVQKIFLINSWNECGKKHCSGTGSGQRQLVFTCCPSHKGLVTPPRTALRTWVEHWI